MTKEDLKQMIVTMCPAQKARLDILYRRNRDNYEGKKDFYGKMIIAGFEATFPNAEIPKVEIIEDPIIDDPEVENVDILDELY